MELQDRTAEIEALVKLDKKDEAYARATAWADEVPQDYRSHLAVALVVCNFMKTDPIDLYFDQSACEQLLTYLRQAVKVADEQGAAYILKTVQPYAEKIGGYAEQHKAAYKYMTAKKVAAKPKQSETKAICDKAKKLLNQVKEEFAAYKQDYSVHREKLKRLDVEFAELNSRYAELEKNPPRGLFGMKQKLEEYSAEKKRVGRLCISKEEEILALRKEIDKILAQAEQVKKQIAILEDDIKEYNLIIAQEKREAQSVPPQALELPDIVEEAFLDRLQREFENVEKLKRKVTELDEKIKKENAKKDFSEYTGPMSAEPGGLAGYYLDQAAKRAHNGRISDRVRELESEKYKLQEEIEARTAFLTCKNK